MPSVGIIKPSTRPGRAEELVSILPPDLHFEHANCQIDSGTREELEASFKDFERNIARMVELDVDLIHTAGVPFMLLGYDGEAKLMERWEASSGKPIFTNSGAQVAALRAFNCQRIVSVSYFAPEVHVEFERYLAEAGFDVLANGWVESSFKTVPQLDKATLRAGFDALWAPHADAADALYLIGPAWKNTLGMVDGLEAAYGVPVIHHIPAQSWEIQRRLSLHSPVQGHGRLVAELPGL